MKANFISIADRAIVPTVPNPILRSLTHTVMPKIHRHRTLQTVVVAAAVKIHALSMTMGLPETPETVQMLLGAHSFGGWLAELVWQQRQLERHSS